MEEINFLSMCKNCLMKSTETVFLRGVKYTNKTPWGRDSWYFGVA